MDFNSAEFDALLRKLDRLSCAEREELIDQVQQRGKDAASESSVGRSIHNALDDAGDDAARQHDLPETTGDFDGQDG